MNKTKKPYKWTQREKSLDFWLHVESLRQSGELTQLRISKKKLILSRSKQRSKKK